MAFTAEHVSRLTGLSERRLRYWDQRGLFAPTYAEPNRRRPYSRIYSFRDVVGLRTLALLRDRHGVSLQRLRELGEWLVRHYDTPWSSLRFYVDGKDVFFVDPESGAILATRPLGQAAIPFRMEEVARQTEEDANRLRERRPDQLGKIEQHRYVLHNAPVLAGTRIPTKAVWDFHRAGYDTTAIIAEYPRLTKADVRAAIAYEERLRDQESAA
jgi:DNA-binding transcriptional MerR regulator